MSRDIDNNDLIQYGKCKECGGFSEKFELTNGLCLVCNEHENEIIRINQIITGGI